MIYFKRNDIVLFGSNINADEKSTSSFVSRLILRFQQTKSDKVTPKWSHVEMISRDGSWGEARIVGMNYPKQKESNLTDPDRIGQQILVARPMFGFPKGEPVNIMLDRIGDGYWWPKLVSFWGDNKINRLVNIFRSKERAEEKGEIRLFTRFTKFKVCSTQVYSAYKECGFDLLGKGVNPDTVAPDDFKFNEHPLSSKFKIVFEGVIPARYSGGAK
jgi:hypothetical protein